MMVLMQESINHRVQRSGLSIVTKIVNRSRHSFQLLYSPTVILLTSPVSLIHTLCLLSHCSPIFCVYFSIIHPYSLLPFISLTHTLSPFPIAHTYAMPPFSLLIHILCLFSHCLTILCAFFVVTNSYSMPPLTITHSYSVSLFWCGNLTLRSAGLQDTNEN